MKKTPANNPSQFLDEMQAKMIDFQAQLQPLEVAKGRALSSQEKSNLSNSQQRLEDRSKGLSLAGVSMFKDEEDIAYLNLAWHYSLGIKKFVILDNMSSDNTPKEIRRFSQDYPDAQVYLIEDRVVGYYQSRKMTAAAEFAHKIWGIEWIFPFDADEFLCSLRVPLETILESIGCEYSFVKILWRHHVLKSIYDQSEPNPLKRMTHRRRTENPRLNLGGFIVRWQSGMTIEQGNHLPLLNGNPVPKINGQELGLVLRHYQFRSRDHIIKKIINGGQAYKAAPELAESFAPHWKLWYHQYQTKGEEFIDEFYTSLVNECPDSVYDPAAL
jgi:hypothetical protein